ncbi:MAG: hypothetical protein ACJ76B_08615 [Solirubrobacterales bacterium]
MTEMTIGQVRAALAKVRAIGRSLEAGLQERIADFPHLAGKAVALGFIGADNPPTNPDAAVSAIEAALAVDKGTVGEGHDYSQGLPEQLPPNGFYGQIENFDVQVYPQQGLEAVAVVASTPAYIRDDEIVALLEDRLNEKDDPRNELLIISCGLPDKAGYLCPPDVLLFHRVKERFEEGRIELKKPEHLRLVALHSPMSNEVVELHRAPDAVSPWDCEEHQNL